MFRIVVGCCFICVSVACFGQTTLHRPSQASAEAVHGALLQHKAGDTTAAIGSLKAYLKTATPDDAIAPMRQLAYLHMAAKNKPAAYDRFLRLANLPPGQADNVRGEAALRMAYLTTGRTRAIWAERIIAGDFVVTPDELSEAYRLAAGAAHSQKNLGRAIELYQQTPDIQTTGSRKSHVLKELAGLYFEVGKGEGDSPVAESVRPQMFDQARDICQAVMTMKEALASHRMVAQLMEAETWFFEGDYDTSYQRATAFFEKYGTNANALETAETRTYLNTAKALQMQNTYFIGRHDEAVQLAESMLEHRPGPNEEFASSDSKLLALLVLKMCALERGDEATGTLYGNQAWQHRFDFAGTEKMMQERRADWVARAAR